MACTVAVPVREPGAAGGGSAHAERNGSGVLRVQDAERDGSHGRTPAGPALGPPAPPGLRHRHPHLPELRPGKNRSSVGFEENPR